MRRHVPTLIVLIVLLVGAGVVARLAWTRGEVGLVGAEESAPTPVEVAPISTGTIHDVRVLTGTLEDSAQFVVAAKVGGLLEQVHVDIGDTVGRDDLVAELDDAEFVQAEAQAAADLSVRRAELAGARSNLDLAEREHERSQALRERGIAAESQLDQVAANLESAKANVTLAEAQVSRADAALALARIQLDYARVRASWVGGPDEGTVGERYQDAGNTVSGGDPIVSVVRLNPLRAVIAVTERDYAGLEIGQRSTLTVDALPGREFEAVVSRIAPVFREASRQARVELAVENPDLLLRPGMFARVRIVLREVEARAIVPLAAITRREGREVVFVVGDDATSVSQVEVTVGITEGDRVQIVEPAIDGRVVVLGQDLLGEDSTIRVHVGEGEG